MARIPGIDSGLSVAAGLARRAVPVAQQAAGTALGTGMAVAGEVATRVGAVVGGTVDTAVQAREAVTALHRLALRAEAIASELEEPLIALRPGLVRLAEVLDDPTISELPDTLRRVQDDVLPVLRSLSDTHDKVAVVAGSTERLMAFVDDTSRTLAGLPGAALLGRRARPAGATPGTIMGELDT